MIAAIPDCAAYQRLFSISEASVASGRCESMHLIAAEMHAPNALNIMLSLYIRHVITSILAILGFVTIYASPQASLYH